MPNEVPCDRLINDGVELYEDGELRQALERFEKALELCPGDVRALLWRGKVELMAGKLDRATATLRYALKGARDPVAVATANFYLALAMFLYSFFVSDQKRALEAAKYHIAEAEKALREVEKLGKWGDLYRDAGPSFDSLVDWLKSLTLIELERFDVDTTPYLMDFLSEIKDIYHRLKFEGFDGLIDRIYGALAEVDEYRKFRTGNAHLTLSPASFLNVHLELPFIDFMADFLHVLLARALVEGYGLREEALSALKKVSGRNVVRALAYLYMAKIYEESGRIDRACSYYYRILDLFDAPAAKERIMLLGCPTVDDTRYIDDELKPLRDHLDFLSKNQ